MDVVGPNCVPRSAEMVLNAKLSIFSSCCLVLSRVKCILDAFKTADKVCWNLLALRVSNGALTYGRQRRHDDVIKWKHFPRYWPFVRGIHRSRWIPRTKARDAELDVLFDLRLNKRLNKQSFGWWFKTPSCSLWRHCNVMGARGIRSVSKRVVMMGQS